MEQLALSYPKKSHRKQVNLPEESVELAEFFGVMMGDGGIGNSWQANISLNAEADAAYIPYLSNRVLDLFQIAPKVWNRPPRKTTVITISSTTIVDFLVSKGLIRGNKLKGGLVIPSWILQNRAYRKICVRGLVDTDGCLYIHKHSVAGKEYENIGLCFTSYSPPLVRQVAAIFEEFGVFPHITNQGRSLYLYKVEAVETYLATFGTSNPRISRVYENWRRGRVV